MVSLTHHRSAGTPSFPGTDSFNRSGQWSVGNRRPMNLRVLSDSVNVPVGPHHSTAVTVFYNYCETKAIVAQCDPIGGSS